MLYIKISLYLFEVEKMNKNHIIIIILIVIIVALIALIALPFITDSQKDDIIIYNNTIEGVGTFNTTNVTNFTLDRETSKQTDYLANDSISQISTTSSSYAIETTISEAEKVNDSAEGHTIYKNTANIGEHKGDVRYFSVLKDNDKDRYIFISTPDYNLTCMVVDSFKIL